MAFRLLRDAGSARSLLVAPFAAAVAASALSACAAPAPEPAPGAVELRVLVKLVKPSQDGGAIAAEAARQTGVAVRYAAVVSPQWHALSLNCADADACETAIARLRSASEIYSVVELEGRKRAL